MIITQLSDDGGALLEAIRRRRQFEPPRRGLHVSTILDDMWKQISKPKSDPLGIMARSSLLFQELGNTIEDIVAHALTKRNPTWVKPSPRQYDGIWCSPDGYSASIDTLDEIKATWVQMNSFLDSEKLQRYVMQVKAYCKVWHCLRVRLHVLFIAGVHRPPFPLDRTYILRFDQDEIDRQWRAIKQHERDRGPAYWAERIAGKAA